MQTHNPAGHGSDSLEKEPSIAEFAIVEDQLAGLREQHGIDDGRKHSVLWRLIDHLFRAKENRAKVPLRKKTYLWLCLLGAFGAHRFYARQWAIAALYLLFCWSGVPLAMTIIDVMVVLPMKADENGIIYL